MTYTKFLVIQQKMIGDVLSSTVICERLKTAYPNCTIHFVANHNTLAVLENNPFIDKVIVFEKKYRSSKSDFFSFLRTLRKESYDGVIDAYGKMESNLITLFSRSKLKISHPKWYTSWIYTDTVKENLEPNGETPLAIQNRLQLLNPVLEGANKVTIYPKIYLSEKEIENARTALNTLKDGTDQGLIMIGILGSSALKTYPAKYMAEVLDFICTQTDAKLLFNYIPNQKKEVLDIYEKCNKETKKRIALDFYAASLRGFLALLSQCNALIGNEGGAVNMAKALEVPTFCVFSPFILKGAWHGEDLQKHVGVHLRDYRPQLFDNLSKKRIKKDIDDFYASFEPALFKDSLSEFLVKNFNRKEEVS